MKNLKFKLEDTTVWSFPKRGDWATHNPKYRGNFAPQIPRNIILRYSNPGDIVLDPMVGGGTTMIESKLLNRIGLGFDINPDAVELTRELLKFEGDHKYEPIIELSDIRKLDKVYDSSIDLIVTHPPYLNIIKYSEGQIDADLSNISSVKEFLDEFEMGIKELFRVLKEDHYCAVLIGDTRKSRHCVPLV
ncbi:site-specific DNA-methyltransferase [Candidatus Dependentiae bacterium]|nr:site-specific DNA-methyltransferase [Candidatus Dependentiae bacterium]